MCNFTQPFQLQTSHDDWHTADQGVGDWPPINVSAACDHYLWELASLPTISSTFGQVSGSVTAHQKTRYMERRSLLQHRRDKCESWLRAINYSTAAPNELSTSCQNVLDIIDEHLRDLEVWLQAAPDDDRRELESITQPQLQRQAQNRFDQLSPAQQQAYWEHLYQQYRANRTQLLGTQEEGAFREYWWR